MQIMYYATIAYYLLSRRSSFGDLRWNYAYRAVYVFGIDLSLFLGMVVGGEGMLYSICKLLFMLLFSRPVVYVVLHKSSMGSCKR